jgi:hypothetical protein
MNRCWCHSKTIYKRIFTFDFDSESYISKAVLDNDVKEFIYLLITISNAYGQNYLMKWTLYNISFYLNTNFYDKFHG